MAVGPRTEGEGEKQEHLKLHTRGSCGPLTHLASQVSLSEFASPVLETPVEGSMRPWLQVPN